MKPKIMLLQRETIPVREFITWSANALDIDIEFKGAGLNEVGVVWDFRRSGP